MERKFQDTLSVISLSISLSQDQQPGGDKSTIPQAEEADSLLLSDSERPLSASGVSKILGDSNIQACVSPAMNARTSRELDQLLNFSNDSNSVDFEEPLARQLFSYHPGMKGLASKESTVTDGVGLDQSSKSIFSTD